MIQDIYIIQGISLTELNIKFYFNAGIIFEQSAFSCPVLKYKMSFDLLFNLPTLSIKYESSKHFLTTLFEGIGRRK